jgi:hypothetical protein
MGVDTLFQSTVYGRSAVPLPAHLSAKPGPARTNDDSVKVRAMWSKALASSGTLIGVALSPHLWVGHRDYPLTPVTPMLSHIPAAINTTLFVVFVCALAATVVLRRQNWAITVALLAGTLLVCLDQSRLQPWFYEYILILFAVRYFSSTSADTTQRLGSINACRLIMASIYSWSGLQKLNPGFSSDMFPWLVAPLVGVLPNTVRPAALSVGFIVPWIELLIGLGLLIRSTRRSAIFGAISMHCFLLLALGPLGHDSNDVVWAWNIVMIALVVVLFHGTPPVGLMTIASPDGKPYRWLVLFAATLAPALSLFGVWDHYASWALYSGARNEATISISQELRDRLPDSIAQHVYQDGGNSTVDISEWSATDLNVPIYPEVRVYLSITRALCRYSSAPQDVRLDLTRIYMLGAKRKRSLYNCSSPQVSGR